ncbi:MAG: prolipoprotein diacylglyceryl transferase [Candidatus Levybacteria bacterium]|nr:prolipoprotein diacylglyceryl transferase [Candidatus Levybacteria bacterium]
MEFFILVLIACGILFLFRLYHLANDDYILTKKNTTLEDVFNAAFVSFALALLFSRIFYVIFNPNPLFLNPLGFLLFPYFPGLSGTGAIIGGIVALTAFFKVKKIPLGRIFDFFSISLTFVLPPGIIGYFILSQDFTTGNIVKLVLYVVMLAASNIYLYPKASSLEIKDGTISALFLAFFSLTSLLGGAIDNPGINYFVTHRENFILLFIMSVSIGFILKREIVGRINIKDGR